jgi:diguanylate cyclase (GGDEF)-like protein/PAS domain S-box-containing protein
MLPLRKGLRQTQPVSRERSVRAYLFWLVLGCLIPGIVGFFVLLADGYQQRAKQLERDTLQTARALAHAVDIQILGLQRLGQGLAAAGASGSDDLAGFHRRARLALTEAGIGATVALTDQTGNMVVNTAAEFGTPLPLNGNPELVQRVFKTGRPVVSRLFTSAINGQPLMAVGTPVVRDGKVIYALTVSIEPQHFGGLLNAQHLPDGWDAIVFDDSGTIAAHSGEVTEAVGRKPGQVYLRELLKAREGNFEASIAENGVVSAAHVQSPETGWRVAVNIPKEEFTSELSSRLLLMAVGIAALFGIGISLAHMMSNRIAGSFQALVAPAVALGAGTTVRLPSVEVKEAREVIRALGGAASLLNERSVALEARERDLAERASALRQSEFRLHTLTEHAPAAIAVFDRSMHYLAVSRRWLEDFQVDDPDIIGACHYDVVPDIPDRWREAHRRGLAGEVLRADADRFERADGSVQWRRWEIWPWRDDRGGVGGIIIAGEEVTERVLAEQQLRESESRLVLALKAADTAVWELDVATERLLPAHERLFTMLGYDPKNFATMSQWTQQIHEDDRPVITALLKDVIDGRREGYTSEARFRDENGEWRWILCQGIAGERTADGKAKRLVGTHTDIHARRLAEQRAHEAALHDPLTGLPNRALVFEYGSHLLAAARRQHGQGALLFIDLDRFKPINDVYGHETGDRVLQEVANRLVACTREEDLVGRLGGDEFVIILPHLAQDSGQAAVVARHVLESIRKPIFIDALELSLSPSIGISFYPEHASDVSTLIHAADLAMYQVKQGGRSNYQMFTEDLNQRADEVYSLEARLKHALKHGGLQLHYQPVMDIHSGALISAEALVRLEDDGARQVGPQVFIPIAEATGLIGRLGEWVVTEACRQHRRWSQQGLHVTIAVNVSPLQFREKGFAEKLSRIIAAAEVDPSRMQVEITESTVMQNLDDAVDILNRIKSLGVKVALDDFGTGHSSLSYLSSLPLDKLKVDQSFVKRIGIDLASQAVTDAIITLGRSLKLEVIGEGIESEESLRFLKDHGCDQAQGYWFSRPLPPEEFAAWCRQQLQA